MPRLSRLFFDAPRPLCFRAAQAIPPGLDTSNPKWIQLCTAGSYVYQGRPVSVSVEAFDDMVRNFRASPAYKPDGKLLLGRPDAAAQVLAAPYGVIALNFDHPPKGGPRPGHGWFLEVERRGSELWGLCWFDAEAYEGLVSGAWKWTSIEWQGQWSDNKGEPIGAYLSGVALTNDPFITGMQPIQMSATAAPPRCIVWFGPAADVLCGLKAIFALGDDEGLAEVLGRIARLRSYTLEGAQPPIGVDVVGILEGIRALLNLPTLTEPASIFAELDTLLGRLADEQERETPMPDPTLPAAKPTELSRRLAARLSACGPLFFGAAAQAIGADDEPRLVLETERFFDRASDCMQQMAALQSAVGAKTPDEMLSKLTELTALSGQAQELQAKINALLPEVEAAHVAEEKAEGELASQDVAAVMSRLAGLGWSEEALASHRDVLMLQRLGNDLQCFGRYQRDAAGNQKLDAKGKPILASPAERQAFRRAATEKFRAVHRIQRADQAGAVPQNYSFANLYAGPGAQYGGQERQAPQGAAAPYMGFSAQGGQQGAPPLPAAQGGWTWSRVAALPPSTDDGALNRIIDEMIRTEIPAGAKPTQAQLSTFFGRAPAILASLGEMPPQFFSAFYRAA